MKECKQSKWNRGRSCPWFARNNVLKKQKRRRITNNTSKRLAETKTETHNDPENADYSGRNKTLNHRRDHILTVAHSSIEKGQTGRHQENKSCGNQNPSYIGTTIYSFAIETKFGTDKKSGYRDYRQQ